MDTLHHSLPDLWLDEFFYGAHNAESTEIDIICIHSMVILSRRSVWQRGLKISAHKFLPCFLLTACLKMIRSNCFFFKCTAGWRSRNKYSPTFWILEVTLWNSGQNYFDLYLSKPEHFTPPNDQISRQNLRTSYLLTYQHTASSPVLSIGT